jgi:cytochrome c
MKKSLSIILLALGALAFSPVASAAGATADEAMALVKKASAFLKANGKEKALAEFNNPKGQFVDRDLYIFAIDSNGMTVANGSNAKLVGQNTINLKDQNDKYFIKEFLKLGDTAGKGWVDYRWVNPVSKNMETKSTYIEKTEGLIIGCGIYK